MRILIPILLSIVLNAPVNGQKLIEKISLIPQVGLSKSILYNSKSPFIDLDYKMQSISNLQSGILFDIKLSDKFYGVSGLIVGKRGGKGIYEEYVESDNTIDSKYREIEIQNGYTTVPILVRRYWTQPKILFFTDFGFYTSFLTNSFVKSFTHEYYSSDGVIINERLEEYIEKDRDFTTNLDFGVLGGIGLEYKLNARVFIQLKFNGALGFVKIDGKYANDTRMIVGTSGTVILELDYFRLNSYSKNFNFGSDLGLRFRLSN